MRTRKVRTAEEIALLRQKKLERRKAYIKTEKGREARRQWSLKNKEKIKEYKKKDYFKDVEKSRAKSREYYAKNAEVLRLREREYRYKNHDEFLARSRARRAADPEKFRNWNRIHRKKNPAAWRLYGTRKQAKIAGVICDLDIEWFTKRLDAGVCEMSGLPFDIREKYEFGRGKNSPSVDRIDPKGPYTKANCRMILWWLNRAMGDIGEEYCLTVMRAVIAKRDRMRDAA